MRVGSLPFDSLGVPLFIDAPKRKWLQQIADKILSKFAKRKGNTLSQASRLVQIKSVISSSLLHPFSIYKWPLSLIRYLEKHTRKFLWSGSIISRKVITVKWEKC